MTIKCDYCGKYTSSPHTIQPQTPISHLEPLDPINLCNACHDKDHGYRKPRLHIYSSNDSPQESID